MCIMLVKNQERLWLDVESEIGQHAVSYFQELLFQEGEVIEDDDMASFVSVVSPSVSMAQNQKLLCLVTLEKVLSAVFSLDPDSAPGPDGYSGIFYRHCWDIISSDLLFAVQEFFARVPVHRIICSTLMVLLPKKQYQ